VLLACDIGNSQLVLGVWRGEELLSTYRLTTRADSTSDEYVSLVGQLLAPAGLPAEGFSGAIVSSVVPPLTGTLAEAMRRVTGCEPLVVSPGIRTGLNILYEDPREVGADRIVNAVGALALREPPFIIVDFGTATTFDLVMPPADYIGGAIAAGVTVSLDALVDRTSKLPKVELELPREVVGRTTADSIRSGILLGHAAMVDGMIARIEAEHDRHCFVVATGGLAGFIQGVTQRIDRIEPDLTLLGLRLLFEKNQGGSI